MAEEAIIALLSVEHWELRSFGAIKKRLKGFDDDALCRLLVRSGAVSFIGKGGVEMWGLRRLNHARLTKEPPSPESDELDVEADDPR